MNNSRKALLLVGSPKPSGSSSESLGVYLLNRLNERGFATEKLHINFSLKTITGQVELLEAVDNCDILILSFPLYADSLPSGIIRAMELLASGRPEKPNEKAFIAICNSGFPEAYQSDTALAICRCFAKEAGYTWAGGFPLGGGGVINGQPLEKSGGMMKNVKKALEITAQALAAGHPIPEDAAVLFRKPLIPSWIYLLIGNATWRIQAIRNGVLMKINDRPFQ